MTEAEFIQANKHKKLPEVALLLSKHSELNKEHILAQINGFQKAKTKLPELYNTTGIEFPSKFSLEQSSSETTAKFKSKLVLGKSLVDLTGGFGVDSYYFSKQFDQVKHIEPSAELSKLVSKNIEILGADNIETINSSAEDFLTSNASRFDVAYIDPSRRNENERVFKLADCVPNIIELQSDLFEITNQVLVKTAPLLDIKQALSELEQVTKVVVVSVNNECKEVLYLLDKDFDGEPQIETVNLGSTEQSFSFSYKQESEASPSYSEPLIYLYEPNASVLKAGAFNSIALEFGLNKIAPNTHLYSSNDLVTGFPGRTFKIEQVLPYQPKAFKKLGIKKANVSTRNFKESVEQVKKKLNVKDGGEHYLFAMNAMNNNSLLLLCSKN